MSHTTTLKSTLIKDIAALRATVAELQESGVKCELLEHTTPRMFYSHQHGECDYVLRLHNSRYDVGFDKQDDGSYVPVMDTFGGHIRKEVGVEAPTCELPKNRNEAEAMLALGKFQQIYAKHAAINAAVAQGYFVEATTTDEQGNIHLTLGGM